MSVVSDILSVFNASAIIIVGLGFIISLMNFIDIARILYEVGLKGYGLPKVAFCSFLSILTMLVAFVLMVFLVLGMVDLQGLIFFLIVLSTLANYYSNRILKNIINELLYT